MKDFQNDSHLTNQQVAGMVLVRNVHICALRDPFESLGVYRNPIRALDSHGPRMGPCRRPIAAPRGVYPLDREGPAGGPLELAA